MRRVLATLLLVASAGVFVLSLTTKPAGADNCAELVKTITDLADRANVEDCLRTGSNWGRVIGTTIGGAGIAIATMGVRPRKSKVRPPESEYPKAERSKDPCVRKMAHAARLKQLEAAREKLGAEILKEFHQHMATARLFTEKYRSIQQMWWRARTALTSARTLTVATWGLVFGALYGVAKPALTLYGWVAAEEVGVGLAGEELLMAQKAAVVKEAIKNLVIWGEATMTSALSELAPEGLGPKPLNDPWAEDIAKELRARMSKVAQAYHDEAVTFNQIIAQWGADRQADLDQIMSEMRRVAEQWKADAQACPQEAGDLPVLGADQDMILQIPQVETGFDDGWAYGGYIR